MERAKSPSSDVNTTATKTPNASPPPPPDQNQNFTVNFTSLYHSIFLPKSPPLFSVTPSKCPSSSFSTEHCLNQARFILKYHQLCEHYDLCLSRLQNLTKELELLRQENANLRLANTEFVKLLSLSSQAAVYNRFNWSGDDFLDFNPRSVIEPNRFQRRRNTLSEGLSVRSNGYSKVNQDGARGGGSTRGPSRHQVTSPLFSGSVQQLVLTGGNGEENEAMKFEVSNQKMWKTKLCNKWQKSGTCLNGDHCQFAHGITELRPIIRHPWYKTQVCRMILAGDTCRYGHKCHFRHSLNEQERLLVGPNGAKREEVEAMKFEVYNQGMWKTELCNQWKETGTCPYGDHCQFAHGITELRLIIKNQRNKTRFCRTILAGDMCRYGNRCHFRHILTE